MKAILLITTTLFLISCSGIQPILHKSNTIDNFAFSNSGKSNGGWDPAYSPDGSRIAFLSSTLHTPADLWVMNADGTQTRRLSTYGVRSFRWTADGKSLMLLTHRKGFEEVLTIDVEGKSGEKRITGLPPGASIPVYSPDGRLFAITVRGEKSIRDLWIGTADGDRIEAVTENIGIRSVFWGSDSRKIYYEAGSESYGVGIWEIDLSTMESISILNKYIGPPSYSMNMNRVVYAYPYRPGEYEIHTMKLDGSDVKKYNAPRLEGKLLTVDATGKGVYYLGKNIREVTPKAVEPELAEKEQEKATQVLPHEKSERKYERFGNMALWFFDFETGNEKRISPEEFHTSGFSQSPDGMHILISGVLKDSFGTEIHKLDLMTGEAIRLTETRVSSWMPVPTNDSSKIAFFTNKEGVDTIKIVSFDGKELESFPGIVQEGDTRFFWLPESGGIVIFSNRGVFAFTENGPIEFVNKGDHRMFFTIDVSIQEDKILLNSVPRYGQTPGLYMLEADDNKFVQHDWRYPPAPDIAADVYIHPKWSFDGNRVAFSDRIDIWTMKSDGRGRARVTKYIENIQQKIGKFSVASYPIWSVRGDKICYTLKVYEEKTILHQLWVMNADGSDPKMLYSEEVDSEFQVYQPEYTNQPFFDYDDKQIIFTALYGGLPNILAVDIRNGKIHRLTASGAIYPVLLPEEGAIVYTSLEGNNERLWIMNSDGSGKHLFTVEEKEDEAVESVEPEEIQEDETNKTSE